MAQPPTRAHGRSLGDFDELSAAEVKLREGCRTGHVAWLADLAPERPTADNTVRAEFVRFLALGGDDGAPVHERGVQVRGAWVEGELDLQGATVAVPLVLWNCRLDAIAMRDATLAIVNLDGSRLVAGLNADRFSCARGVLMRNVDVVGTVRLIDGAIGTLDCRGSRFLGRGGEALIFDRLRIGGSALLEGCRVTGKAMFGGARIGGDLRCSRSRFACADAAALFCDGMTVDGSIWLNDGCRVLGAVRLVGVTIGGDLYCEGGHFSNAGGDAFSFNKLAIGGALMFREVVRVRGCVNLNAMSVRILGDDIASWTGGTRPRRPSVATRQNREDAWASAPSLRLDGFTYARIGGRSPTDASMRVRWLRQQVENDIGTSFKPQPWEQIIAVLRAMGHPEEARCVAAAKQHWLRVGKWPGARGLRRLFWAVQWAYGVVFQYGYWPWRPIALILGVWLGCAVVYGQAAAVSTRGPPVIDLAKPAPPATPGGTPPRTDYASFSPLIYSADVLLPFVNFGHEADWAPVAATPGGRALRWVVWLEILFGWIAGLVLGAAAGGLIRKD